MAYVPHKPFAKVILPIMVKKGSIMIGISTYGEPNNFFTKLLSQKASDGTPMFRQIEYSTICRRCLEKGVKKVCQHRRGELPHWHDEHEYEQIFEMLKDDPDIALMELGGISADSSIQPYFSKHKVMELKRMKTNSGINFIVDLKGRQFEKIYVTIDPCGQGNNSDYGLLSAVYTEGEMIIIGLEATDCGKDAQRGVHLVRHIQALQQMRSFRYATFIIIVENNYGGSVFANNHASEVKMENVANVQFARRNKSGKPDVDPGVYTTSVNKPKMLEKLAKFINLRGIRFSEYMVSVCDPSRDATAMTHFFVDQLLGFREKIEEDPQHPENPSKVIRSGKIGPMKRDDLVDVAAMSLFWHNQISL